MTVARESNSSERARELHMAQLLQGPAQRALAYCYSYCYTRSSDVLGYVSQQDLRLHFTPEELSLLARARSPKLLSIPALYKIFKYCCEDKLDECYSRQWDASKAVEDPVSLEAHIAAIHHQHEAFSSNGGGQVELLSQVILGLVRAVGERLGVNKWKQQHDSLKQSIDDILEEVHPAMDVKERVATAAVIEAGMMCASLTAAVSGLSAAVVAGLEDRKEEVLLDIPCVITVMDQGNTPNQGEDACRVQPEDLLEVLHKKCSERIDGKQICCISGEHGTGKTTLATKFPVCWSEKSDRMKGVELYDYVLFVSGKDIEQTSIEKWTGTTTSAKNNLSTFIDSYWSVVEAFLPRCCAKYGVKNVGQLITTKKVLFIIDDADEISDSKVKELILFLGQIIFDSSVLIFGNLESIVRTKLNFISYSSVQHFHLHGLSVESILEISKDFTETVKTGKKKINKSFRDSFKNNLNRFANLMQYPEFFKDIFTMWKIKCSAVRDTFSASELLWNMVTIKSERAFEMILDKDISKKEKWLQWLMVVGENCLYCFRANFMLNEASYSEIRQSAEELFSAEESERLMAEFFKKRLTFSTRSFLSIPTSVNRAQLEYFSSYYVAHQMRDEETLLIKDFLPKTGVDEFIAMVGGHLRRWEDDEPSDGISEEVDVEDLRRIVTNLVTNDPSKLEDIHFFMKLATEFRCCHKLIQFMVNVTEYPEEWDLNLGLLHQRTLEVMLTHVSPVRIILRIDKNVQNYEQLSLLKFLHQVPISVWFESKEQFKYGSNKKMDTILRPFFSDKTRSRVDLLSGTLSQYSMLDFTDYKCMSYIVMLALKVSDEPQLQCAVALPARLPHILWFELKIDMPIKDIVLTSLPSMEVEMFDVYLRDLDDLAVPQISGLLYKLHKRYSGIHLEQTSLSPESIYTLLKNLKQRHIALCATAKSIDKYRRWYYPLLSNMPKDRLLTDKEVKKILGFEDRRFYSDHKIDSSTFVKSIDAWNLTSYLEDLKEIRYFQYKADNLSFTKTLKGTIDTKHYSEIQVDTTGTIL